MMSVRSFLESLPEPEGRVLTLRFGFGGEPWTLKAIAEELDLTIESVRQIESRALTRLSQLGEAGDEEQKRVKQEIMKGVLEDS